MTRLVKKKGETIELTQENQYNGNGQRIRKSEADDTTRYFYQDDSVLCTMDETDNLTSWNLLAGSGAVIGTTRGTGTAEEYYLYTKDIRESTTNIIDDTGAGVVSYQYDDFGETETFGNQNFFNEICYTGGIHDASTGIYYLNARYYDPASGVFLSQDSYRGELNDPASLNLYGYCQGNPVTYTDPSGHIAIILLLIAGANAAHKVYKAAKTVKTVYKVYKGASTVKKITKTASTAKKTYNVVRKAKKVVKAASKAKKSKSLKKITNKSCRSSRVKKITKTKKKNKVSENKKSSSSRWKVGESITKPTKNGKPSWSTVRSRYWKNEAKNNRKAYNSKQLERMKSGRTPQRKSTSTGKLESMELHHKFPRRAGGSNSKRNLKKLWPEEHAATDKHRYLKKGRR